MAQGTPTSAKTLLILIGAALVIVIAATMIFYGADGPVDDGEVAAPAPEQQVESEDTGMPVSPHRPDSLLADPPVNQDAPVDEEPLYED